MDEGKERIQEIETLMLSPDFWRNKDDAQKLIRELQELKKEGEGGAGYDREHAIVSIFAGAGGDDAEDFAAMLARMYQKYSARRGWSPHLLSSHENDHGGFRSITFAIEGKGSYGILKNEAGVHRLVRISPFSAKQLRHTSFVLVEVVPRLKKVPDIEIPESDLDIQFARSSGPGGQNVNKRETAVRLVHIPTGVAVHVETERSQQHNKERALEILTGKLYRIQEEQRKRELKGLSLGAPGSIEWGNQIRSYVLHPYQMVKDHRTNAETRNIASVLEEGDLDLFIDAEKGLE